MNDENGATPGSGGRALAFRVIAILLGIAVAEGGAIAFLLLRPARSAAPKPSEGFIVTSRGENLIKQAYPAVDFTRIYPGWKPEDIDLLQRECFGLRYLYEPFVEFRLQPAKKRYVEITEAGYRAGLAPQPWPPDPNDFVIFVFGGSTTLGYGVPNEQTVVSHLQTELGAVLHGVRVQCYNFGSGYYFSTQERARFEGLLMSGIVPKFAVFVDGLNEYYFADGRPFLTPVLHRYLAPDLPPLAKPPIGSDEDRTKLVDALILRYKENVRMIEALGRDHGAGIVFVGQPVPFFDYPRNAATYPFEHPFAGNDLCIWGYGRFQQAGATGVFGQRFLWCGDIFSDAQSSMYADGVHYSPEGSRLFARAMAQRIAAQGLFAESGLKR